jgi:hypothetical protein
MHNIEAAIKEYCARNLPTEPAWITFLERRFPEISGTIDASQWMRKEFADHLQDSYQSHFEKGHSPDDAWRLAQEHFGDTELLAKEIRKIRRQSCKCLLVRFAAIIALLVLPSGKYAKISPHTFLHPQALFLMAVCVILGYWITKKRDSASLRKYALYGAWLGLFWGIYGVAKAGNDTALMGRPVSFMLISTFYGLFFAAPASRRFFPAAMLMICQIGMSITLLRGFHLTLVPETVDFSTLKMTLAACTVSMIAGLIVFDIRKLHQRIAGIAALGMIFAWIKLLVNLTAPPCLLSSIFATSLPPLIAVLMILPIKKIQQFLLQEAS